MRAVRFVALRVKIKRMLPNDKAASLGDLVLTAFNFFIEKLFNASAVNAYQMVMVLTGPDLEYRFARLEMVALQEARLLELGQYAIDGRQADVHVFVEQHSINIISTQVTYRGVFKKLEDLEAGESGFEPHALEITRLAHGFGLIGGERRHLFRL